MARTYNKTCKECKEPFATRGPSQKLCDSCWGEMMGAIRVEYLARGSEYARTAIIVCRGCDTEYATRKKNPKRPGLCKKCSITTAMRTPEARAKMSAATRGRKHTPEARAKMSAAHRGRKHTPEARAKISTANRGRKYSAETRAKISAALRGKKMSAEARAKIGAATRGRKHTPEARAKMSAATRGRKMSAEARAKIAAAKRGKKASPEARANMSASARKANHERRRQGVAQGGKYGWIYVVSGPGQVKVGASMDEKTLASRLALHERHGLTEVHATWQVDPKQGSKIEAAAVAAALAGWEQVGTIVRPIGGTETVWCDDPAAIVALVESVITQEQY